MFLKVIKNVNHQAITIYEDKMFYLSRWIKEDNMIVKELKLKFYYECLAYLHSKTFSIIVLLKVFLSSKLKILKELFMNEKLIIMS